MLSSLRDELRALLSERGSALSVAIGVRGANDRVDALALLCREVVRASSLCFVSGRMHFFDSRLYVPVAQEAVSGVLGDLLVDMGASPTDVRKMGSMPLSVALERSFSPDGDLVAFSNGVYRLSSGVFSEGFSRESVVTTMLPYAFEAEASCPRWDKFLNEVLPDPYTRNVLQEFFGMVFLDRRALSVEKFAIFVGKGANGKSVIFEVMRRVLGDGNVSTLDASQLTDDKMLPELEGKRLNFAPDMAQGKTFTSALKALASGQEVTARAVFKDASRVSAPPLCFALNEMPLFSDNTDAFFRRILLFSFDVVIPEERQDRTLVSKICASDLPGIFLWMMEGRSRLVRSGGVFSRCPKMESALAALRQETDGTRFPVRSYLESHGYSLRPVYQGQPFTLISQNEIELRLRNSVSRYAITAELRRAGVKTFRSKELFYKVYLSSENDTATRN